MSKDEYLDIVIENINTFQKNNLYSDRDISQLAWLSITMISKIKSKKTIPKIATLRKLKVMGIGIPPLISNY